MDGPEVQAGQNRQESAGAGPVPAPAGTFGLAEWLAERDAPCPACGYNLRGVASDKCPECGATLELELRRRRPAAGWGAFLILVFGWLFVAGTLNTVRSLRDLVQMQQQSAVVQKQMAAARAQIQAQLKRLQADAESGDSALDRFDDGFPGSDVMKQMRRQVEQDMQAMMQRTLQAQMASMAAPSTPVPTLAGVWMSSGWKVQVGSAGFAGLGLGGAIGLLALIISRVRNWPESRVRVLAAVGVLMFGLYAAWHITLFASEFR